MTLHELIRIGLMIGAMLLAAGGFGLVLLGLRGKRVGEHPHCAHCGYDLFGVAGHACPECGASVGDVSKIPPGRKRVRKRWVLLGVVLLIVHVEIHWIYLCKSVPQYGLYSNVPEWLLVQSVRRGDSFALSNLTERIEYDSISNEAVAQLAAMGIEKKIRELKQHSDWDKVIVEARGRNLLSDDVWARYVKSVALVTLSPRPEVRQGDPLPLLVTCLDPRNQSFNLQFRAGGECATIEIDGRKVFEGPPELGECSERGSWSGSIEADRLRGLGPGTHHIRMTMPTFLYRSIGLYYPYGSWIDGGDMTIEADFNLLPTDKSTVRAVLEPALQRPLRSNISVGRYDINGIAVNLAGPPRSIAFNVTIRSGDKIRQDGLIACAKSMRQWGSFPGFTALGAAASKNLEPIDVIFTPDAEAAIRSVSVTDYWDGEPINKRIHGSDD